MSKNDFNGWQDRRTAASVFPKGCNTHLSTLPSSVFFLSSLLSVPLHFVPPKLNAGWKAGLGVGIILPAPPPRPGDAGHQDRWSQHLQVRSRGTWSHMPAPPPPLRPLSLLSSPPAPNANLIYDVCTEEMTLQRPFKSSCHCRSPCPGSLLISTPFLLKLKAFSQLGNSC